MEEILKIKCPLMGGQGESVVVYLFYHGAVSVQELPEATDPESHILTPDARGVPKITLTVGSFSER